MLLPSLSVLLLPTILLASPADLYLGDDNVLHLTTANYKKLVTKSNKPVLTKFYSPGCPHCVNLKGVWRKVAQNLKGHIPVAAVNCQEDALCSKFGVKGVPSIKLLDSTGGAIEYAEGRTVEAFVNFAKRHVPSEVKKISLGSKKGMVTLEDFLSLNPNLPKVLLMKKGSMAPSMPFKTLSTDFKGKIDFGIVNGISEDGKGVAAKLGVEQPTDDTLILMKAGERKGTVYDGKLAFTELKKFFTNFAKNNGNNEKQEL